MPEERPEIRLLPLVLPELVKRSIVHTGQHFGSCLFTLIAGYLHTPSFLTARQCFIAEGGPFHFQILIGPGYMNDIRELVQPVVLYKEKCYAIASPIGFRCRKSNGSFFIVQPQECEIFLCGFFHLFNVLYNKYI